MTHLTSPVRRLTRAKSGKRQIVAVLASAGTADDALLALRPIGKRVQYVASIKNLYTLLAMWHGMKEKRARYEARKNQVPWRVAKKQFLQSNSVKETGNKRRKS